MSYIPKGFPAINAQNKSRTRRTRSAGKHRDSVIWQRRGGEKEASHAESSRGPNSPPRIENVNNIECSPAITAGEHRNSVIR
jgi:hypothetical protein